MKTARLLLCCDLDRTLIPNGDQPESPAAREQFSAFCARPEVCLAYVTGRHRQLVNQAIADYRLPVPDFAVTDVGSKIYRLNAEDWREVEPWQKQIAADWRGKNHAHLEQALRAIPELQLQEVAKQNRYKLSYYLALDSDKVRILKLMAELLGELAVDASLIFSIDEQAQIGLLDVLPKNATKLHALEFLQQRLGYARGEVLFAGDSGNDLPVLGSGVRSVLVANANAELKDQACELARRNGHGDALYLARNHNAAPVGNYAAGVLQGVWHFCPEFHPQLQGLGFDHEF